LILDTTKLQVVALTVLLIAAQLGGSVLAKSGRLHTI